MSEPIEVEDLFPISAEMMKAGLEALGDWGFNRLQDRRTGDELIVDVFHEMIGAWLDEDLEQDTRQSAMVAIAVMKAKEANG